MHLPRIPPRPRRSCSSRSSRSGHAPSPPGREEVVDPLSLVLVPHPLVFSPPTCSLTRRSDTCPYSSSRSFGLETSEDVEQDGDRAGPPRLVAGAEPRAVVTVEVFIEEDQIAPVRIVLELGGAAVDRPPSVGVAQERARQPAGDSPEPLRTASCTAPSRSGTEL